MFREEEHFFAFFVRASDRDNGNYDRETSRRLIAGIQNNLPHLMPETNLSSSTKRRGLRNLGLRKPNDMLLSAISMAAFPVEIDPIIRIVAIKIALALFYRHKGVPAKRGYWVWSSWTHSADQKSFPEWSAFAKDLPGLEIGKRTNVDLGNRFRYRWAVEEPDSSEIFASIAQFGDGLTLCMIVSEECVLDDQEEFNDWIKVEDWSERKFTEKWMKP